MEKEPVTLVEEFVFGKDEISRRLQLPMDCIDMLVEEHSMPTDDEEEFVEWGLEHFDILWQEMKVHGPIAQMETNSPVASSQPSDGNLHKSPGI